MLVRAGSTSGTLYSFQRLQVRTPLLEPTLASGFRPPELVASPTTELIHHPWLAPEEVLDQAGIVLGDLSSQDPGGPKIRTRD
jgi:hypothetical protein